uniref:hypothetical protein RF1 n=1 Tax=Gayralia brasiliensis TaxID=1286870 RepID=UPI002410DE39|nr:hypothetical protein RF1 [Gayralia brasiliensis]YP_010733758.1 hypothetical protein RF1 [Monostroma nitidum]WEG92955.1 hypothetical protein RF1 [Gayralia brasiliensis]WEG93029.1 hypothetical protein RF1 [Monostroma nitidum]
MFFVHALKDYVDQLNDLVLVLNENFTVFTFLKASFLYLIDSIKFVLFYILSCKWLTDFIELPCTFKDNYIAIIEGKNILESELNPSFFEFLETKTLSENSFVTGFLNGFFLALPFSVPHLLALRAFLINGLVAGIYSAAGILLAQFSFFVCVFLGFEFLLTPFLSFEPFNYILGFVIVVNVLYNMVHKPNLEVLNKSQSSLLLSFFGLNFLLTWTEQTSFFQYFGNLTMSGFPTLLQGAGESYQISGFFNFFLPTFLYLIGLLIASVLWTLFFGFLFTLLRNFVSRILTIPFMLLNEKINNFLFVCTFTLCLTSIPYYGFDYLVSTPLGFISQDKTLDFLKTKPYYQVNDPQQNLPWVEFFINPVPFDRPSQMEPKCEKSCLKTFEDVSVEPENTWKNRVTLRASVQVKSSRQMKSNKIESPEEKNAFRTNYYKLTDISGKANILQIEKNIDLIASKLFNSISYDYYNDLNTESANTRKKFREKFYKNPVYKTFVHLDMIGFLQGQPKSYNLTPKQEADLYKRRFILENYLDSIQNYKTLVLKKKQHNSYAEKIYNQQFKGSLDIVRHFFLISLTSNVNNSLESQKVLKFDQPLYKTSLKNVNPLLHEELDPAFSQNSLQQMQETNATPFYIGWDGSLRKFLVKKAGTPGIPFGKEAFSNTNSQNLPTGFPTYLAFQSWPVNLTQENLEKKTKASIPYIPLSEEQILQVTQLLGIQNTAKKAILKKTNLLQKQNLPFYNWNYCLVTQLNDANLPKNLSNYIDLGNTPPPQFSGFAWPGTTLAFSDVANLVLKQK